LDFIIKWRENYFEALNSKDPKLRGKVNGTSGWIFGNYNTVHNAWQKQDKFRCCSIVKTSKKDSFKPNMKIENEIMKHFNEEGVNQWPKYPAYRHAWGNLLRNIIYPTKNPPNDKEWVYVIADKWYSKTAAPLVKPYLKD